MLIKSKLKRYIVLFKPYNVLSQFTGGASSFENLSQFNLPPDVYPVGRLDKDSEGLLLLSDDGVFASRFLHSHPRKYWVWVDGEVRDEELNPLRLGLKLPTYTCLPCQCNMIPLPEVFERNPPLRVRKKIPINALEITMTEGKNRQIRHMTAAIGHPTLRLMRIGLGKIQFQQNLFLKPGEWQEVERSMLIND